MKSKIIQIFIEVIIIGSGAVLTNIIETAGWAGVVVIVVGVLGLTFTLAGKKIADWIPLRIVKKVKDKQNMATASQSIREQIIWSEGLIREQRNQPQKYLHPHLRRLFVSNPSELGFEVDWFNCTIFGIEFTSLNGEVTINDINMGHQLKLRGTFSCSPCEPCICTFDIMVDHSVIQLVEKAKSEASCIKCGFLLNWDVSPAEEAKPFLKPFRKQWSENNILTIPK